MKVLGMLDAENEVDHLGRAVLGLLDRQRGLGVDGLDLGLGGGAAGRLGKDAGAVGEGIAYRGIEAGYYTLEQCSCGVRYR